jgi:phenylacetate-CoA ligase
MNRQYIYDRLPILAQNVACSFEGWKIKRSRYGPGFWRMLTDVESRSFWSADQIYEFRDARVRAFVQHCERTVPYYRRKFRELGVSSADIRNADDIRILPILTKQEVRDNYADFISEAVPKHLHITVQTSGTTGAGFNVTSTESQLDEIWAVWWRYRRWHGIGVHTPHAVFGGRLVVPVSQTQPPFWRKNWASHQILFSSQHLSPANVHSYVRQLRRSRLPWLHGYPSLLALIAAHLLESGEKLPSVRWVTTGAENLLPNQSALLERAFAVHPRQHYGMAEAAANISECERGSMHVDEDFSLVEFVPDPVSSSYRVIGTNLSNLVIPLLRYDVQDLAYIESQQCACGRPGRVVKYIDGRQEDYIILRNGARVACMNRAMAQATNVHEAQFQQDRPGEVTLVIVRGDSYSDADEFRIRAELFRRLGDTTVHIRYVDRIDRGPNGKLRLIKSTIVP